MSQSNNKKGLEEVFIDSCEISSKIPHLLCLQPAFKFSYFIPLKASGINASLAPPYVPAI